MNGCCNTTDVNIGLCNDDIDADVTSCVAVVRECHSGRRAFNCLNRKCHNCISVSTRHLRRDGRKYQEVRLLFGRMEIKLTIYRNLSDLLIWFIFARGGTCRCIVSNDSLRELSLSPCDVML